MGGFYLMRYEVPTENGSAPGIAALWLRRGQILGIDTAGVRYEGTYSDDGNRMRGSVILDAPVGARMAIGAKVDKPTSLVMPVDLPSDFADGRTYAMVLQGRSVPCRFERLMELR